MSYPVRTVFLRAFLAVALLATAALHAHAAD
ncbi:MAG: hypothetical protein JWQ03_981, partial [Variovorax sp.]|nr:hypothetical protein [Variovorax sp.]